MAKICFAASSGGHLEQLMMMKPLMNEYESFIVTEKTDYQSVNTELKTYYLKQVNRREALFPLYLLYNSFVSLYIFLKEKPDYIVTTGVLAMIPLCLLCKLFGRKLIYLESYAKVHEGTLSGKLLYKYADNFLVQWKDMLKVYPNAVYVGGIY